MAARRFEIITETDDIYVENIMVWFKVIIKKVYVIVLVEVDCRHDTIEI